MAKHPAGPFTVRVHSYPLTPYARPDLRSQIYSSRHTSPAAAARRLATIITGKSEIAKQVKDCILAGQGSTYIIQAGDGRCLPLIPFRRTFSL